jgi:hypothetical protein
MGGDPAPLVEDLHGGRRKADPQQLPDQLVGGGVVVPLGADLDVVVEAQASVFPGGELVADRRKGPKRWAVELLEQRAARPLQLLEGPVVEPGHQHFDRHVELGQGAEPAVAQAGDDPSLCQQDTTFGLSLILLIPNSGLEG